MNLPDYFEDAKKAGVRLNEISPTMCMAKWLQVTMHLPAGLTHSCHHPPAHKIPLNELSENPRALHNTVQKAKERREMWQGKRPSGCNYCWNIEDAPNGPHLSDRHYRSGEWWVADAWQEVVDGTWDENINPRYVEVNFNQACNLKCTYCSPHLSTAWEREVQALGPLILADGQSHNNLDALADKNIMPLSVSQKDNPYIAAFWKWWPELYPDLKVFRMTGGEPLMDKNTFRVFDYIATQQFPNSNLELSVTSNMSPDHDSIFDTFLESVKRLETVRRWNDPAVVTDEKSNYWVTAFKNFSLFVSVDSTHQQAEYIRTGLDYNKMLGNVREFLSQTQRTEVNFINTFSLLSIPQLKNYLQMILDLRVEFGYDTQLNKQIMPPRGADPKKWSPSPILPRQRIWFDIPLLTKPEFMSANLAIISDELMNELDECVRFMESNVSDNYSLTYHGFKQYEIAKLKRNISLITQNKEETLSKLDHNMENFYLFFSQIDSRRNQSFVETFPELVEWWDKCKHIAQQKGNK